LQSTDHGSSDPAALALTHNKAARVQTFGYDAAGRLTRFTNVDGVVETYAYDSANNRISETITNPNALAGGRIDPPVRTTTFEFDGVNRQTKQTSTRPGSIRSKPGLRQSRQTSSARPMRWVTRPR
jgi:YD repeat-containing protein